MQRNTESVKGTITPPSGMFRVLPESPLRVITTTNVLTITSFWTISSTNTVTSFTTIPLPLTTPLSALQLSYTTYLFIQIKGRYAKA